MLILDSGILLALSLSCGYNFEVWEVEPPCTCVKAEAGDKALTSWWAVKLGRNQQMNKNWNSRYLNQLDYPTQYEFFAAIFRICMGLLKKVQLRDWSQTRPQSLNHDPLEQLSVRLCHGTKTSCLGFRPGFLSQNPCLLSKLHSERALYYCFLRGRLSNQCQRVPALPLLPLNFQHSELEKRRWSLSWSVYPFYVFLWWWRC